MNPYLSVAPCWLWRRVIALQKNKKSVKAQDDYSVG